VGITALISAGDSGAAGCDAADETTATQGLGVSALCSPIYDLCVGGTEFNENGNPSMYWSSNGDALGYIPEVVWNESGSNGGMDLWATGGGYSTLYSTPAWQAINTYSLRGVPDVALTAAGHDGYFVCFLEEYCNLESFYYAYGTSAASPSFAGILALMLQTVNQQSPPNAYPSLGVVNPLLYGLENTSPYVFNVTTGGNNSVPGQSGYAALGVPGWSPTTGLGSVDVTLLAGAFLGPTVVTEAATLITGNSATLNGTVNPNGTNTTYWFRYSINPNLAGNIQTSPTSAGNGTSPVAVSANISDLNPDSIYYYQLQASNNQDTGIYVGGNIVGFTTLPSPSCTYSLSSYSISVGAAASNGSVNVITQPGCAWTAASNVSWLSITSGSSGSGNGTVNFAVAANTSSVPLTGTLTIAGLTFTVNQAASGAPSSPLTFFAITPCRIADTRAGNGFSGAFGPPYLSAGVGRSFPIQSSSCNVPATAQAYSLNLTVVPHGILDYLTAWPTGEPQPLVSTLNALFGQVIANAALVPAGIDGAGSVSLFASNDTDAIIDIDGYFAPEGGLAFIQRRHAA
jgi:hypothetical protein